MYAQQAILKFSEAERPQGERLLNVAFETDRVEGYSEPHAVVIAHLAEIIGAQVGMHGNDLTALKFAALAHDIGERAMKRNYLLRPDTLSLEEMLDLWRHPILGEQAAGELRLSRQAQLLIRWHHEWWNGLGYPDGLAGQAIPIGARILRVVDSYCALISNRPHRPRFDENEAAQRIADQAGLEFDPLIVKLLLALLTGERKQQEIPSAAPDLTTQVIFTPEGLQAAVVATELQSDADTVEVAGAGTEAESQTVELPVDFQNKMTGSYPDETLAVVDPDLPPPEYPTVETKDLIPEAQSNGADLQTADSTPNDGDTVSGNPEVENRNHQSND